MRSKPAILLFLALGWATASDLWSQRALEGLQLQTQGRLAEARQALCEALQLAREAQRHPVELASIHNRIAAIDLETSELELARLELQRAEVLLTGRDPDGREERIVCLLQRSILAFNQRRFREAAQLASEALTSRDQSPLVSATAHAEIHQQLAVSLHAAREPQGALEHFRLAQEHCQGAECPVSLLAALEAGAGLLNAEQGRPSVGMEQLGHSLEMFEKAGAPVQVRLRPMNNLAVLFLRARNADRALQILTRASQDARTVLGPSNPLTATILMNRSVALKLKGKKREARADKEAAERAMAEWMRRNELQHSVDYSDLLTEESLEGGSFDR